jgi:predicted unusual protein kinase regulating ubiquinone biosynthesis (AarF/ABC1/UbiB family)
MEKLGFLKKDSDYGKLIPIMEYFFDEIVDKINLEKETMLSINLTPVVDEIIDVVYEQPFRLPYKWAYIGRTLGALTGIISHLYPNIKLFEELKPHFNRVVKENFSEIIEEVKNAAKDFLKQLFVLPERANTFITKVERGRINFEIDPNEIDQRADLFQTVLTKSVGVSLSLFSAFFSYYFLIRDEYPATIVFGSLSLVFLGVFLFYKKRNSKDMIKKRFKK